MHFCTLWGWNLPNKQIPNTAILELLDSQQLFHVKSMWEKNSQNFHTVEIMEFYCLGYFSKKFRQINVLLKNFIVKWFDGKNICVAVNFSFFHTVGKKIFRQINYLVISLVKLKRLRSRKIFRQINLE